MPEVSTAAPPPESSTPNVNMGVPFIVRHRWQTLSPLFSPNTNEVIILFARHRLQQSPFQAQNGTERPSVMGLHACVCLVFILFSPTNNVQSSCCISSTSAAPSSALTSLFATIIMTPTHYFFFFSVASCMTCHPVQRPTHPSLLLTLLGRVSSNRCRQ